MRKKLKELLSILEKETHKMKRQTDQSRKAVVEIAKEAIRSWSIAGERNYAEGQAEIMAESLARLENLMEEVKKALNEPIPDKIEPVCFIKVGYEDGRQESLYVVNTPVFIREIKTVSVKSPFGQALLGKRIGEKFKYHSAGQILSIE